MTVVPWVSADEELAWGYVQVTESTGTPEDAVAAFLEWEHNEGIVRVGEVDELIASGRCWWKPNEANDWFVPGGPEDDDAMEMWSIDLTLAEVEYA